jgi:hypothetical protein
MKVCPASNLGPHDGCKSSLLQVREDKSSGFPDDLLQVSQLSNLKSHDKQYFKAIYMVADRSAGIRMAVEPSSNNPDDPAYIGMNRGLIEEYADVI